MDLTCDEVSLDSAASYSDDWDWTCHKFSARLSSGVDRACELIDGHLFAPLIPGQFHNATNKIQMIAERALLALAALLTTVSSAAFLLILGAPLMAASKGFRSLGFALQKERCTHIQAPSAETALSDHSIKIASWPVDGDARAKSYEKGVIHWRFRVAPIVEKVEALKKKPDVLVFQGVFDTDFVKALVEKLQYPHSYGLLGGNGWSDTSGLLVMTQCPVAYSSHADFTNNGHDIQRGFHILEIKANLDDPAPVARVVSANFSPDLEEQEDQLRQIAGALKGRKEDLPTFFVGNLKVNKGDPYLSSFNTKNVPTFSQDLALQWDPHAKVQEVCNTIALFKPSESGLHVTQRNVSWQEPSLIEAFEGNDTQTALSSSHGLVCEAKIEPMRA